MSEMFSDGCENLSADVINKSLKSALEEKREDTEVIEELLSGKWVDAGKVQRALGLSFEVCFSLFEFSRTAEWWSVVGKTEEERARNGQRVETAFRLKREEHVDRDQIMAIAERHGFTLWATERGGSKVEFHFMDKEYGVNLWVNEATLSYRFEWMIPHSGNSIKSPVYALLSKEEHFKKMLEKFKKPVEVLYREDERGRL